MSHKKNELTENNNFQSRLNINNNKNNSITYISDKSEQIKSQNNNYKYKFSYKNNSQNYTKTSQIENIDNVKNINIKSIKPKNVPISKKSNILSSTSKLNCETKYSINKMTNMNYVNGLNKNIAKQNKERFPDLKFISYEKKDIYEKKRFSLNQDNKRYINTKNNYNCNNIKNERKYNNEIKYEQYFSEEELNNKRDNMNISLDLRNNNTKDNSRKYNNHSFKSIRNCSSEKKNINSKRSTNNQKYKCDIKIYNVNSQKKENIRTFSYDNSINKRSSTNTKIFLSDHSRAYEDLEYEFMRHKSFDKRYLKMQNSQNMQILQEEKLYQILLPIPPNEIDYICDFEIKSEINNDYIENKTTKNINIKTTEIISEKEINTNNNKNNNFIKRNIKYKKNTSWRKSNSPNKIKNKDLKIANFSLNFNETSRKFKGEMIIENTGLNYERSPRKWNDVLQLKSNKPLSIERGKKEPKVLSEASVEKLTYKGKIMSQNNNKNWNQINNKENVEKIILIPKRPNKIISKQKKELFTIPGQEKHWNDLILKKDGNNFVIKSNGNQNIEEEKEQDNIINEQDIEKSFKRNVKYIITRETKNGVDNSESSSEYDILKRISTCNNNKYENIIKNSFETNGKDRKVIINNIRKYHEIVENNQNINRNSFYKKKIIKNKEIISNNSNNNLITEVPETKVIINPHYKSDKENENIEYIYRQSITNKDIFKKTIGQNKLNKEDNLDNENDTENPTSETKGISDLSINIEGGPIHNLEFPTPTSNMRCEFREEIKLSPKYENNERENIQDIDNNNLNDNSDKNADINYMEEEYNNYTNIQNLEKQEKLVEVISEKERKSKESNSSSEKNDNNNNLNGSKSPINYICKKKSTKANQNKNKTIIKQKMIDDNLQKNENNLQENLINNSNLQNDNDIKKESKNETDYDINFPQEEKKRINLIEEEEKQDNNENSKNINMKKVENNINEEIENINQNNPKTIKININDSKEENNFEKSNGLYNSNHSKINKSDIFVDNGHINFGNITINNTLKRKKKKIKDEKKNDDNNLIHHFENKTANLIHENSINNPNQYDNLNSKVRILKK